MLLFLPFLLLFLHLFFYTSPHLTLCSSFLLPHLFFLAASLSMTSFVCSWLSFFLFFPSLSLTPLFPPHPSCLPVLSEFFQLSHHLSVTISISSITLSCSSHFGSHFHFFLSSLHSHTVFFCGFFPFSPSNFFLRSASLHKAARDVSLADNNCSGETHLSFSFFSVVFISSQA